ncbi:NAD(P)H-dependent oxidoreductase [Pseudoalteromonas sp. MMG024]|uniref:NAD(P)H-dependent oxidoreductase n=1 Tax=Pseudoalteromonas sp. MMG024 TaxID=2909980 RepID=UPI001F3EE115|nr:NAD(P)H-dependent oxidoreductase [Pseudoalteromonas sp. MMG024]MCF6456542.1 NAD(P)H-dependent oxidoreductase [Pseudoalteromonas sp. MMG024]
MKIVIVSGSGRPNSNSLALATKISKHLVLLDIECDLVDLSEMTRLLHHYETHNDAVLNKQKALLLEKLYSSDGIVIVAPEWGGMLPPVLHNFLLLSAYGFPLGHKPALVIGISTSGGGHNPVSLLKGYSALQQAKNHIFAFRSWLTRASNLCKTARPNSKPAHSAFD